MAIQVGPGDIVKGIELALAVYQKGFIAENAAGVRYGNFKQEILDFAELLEKLNNALQNARDRYRRYEATREQPLHIRLPSPAHDPLSDDFERERIALIGNFEATLNECHQLLEDNRRYQKLPGERNQPILNLQWYLTQQEQRVEDLKRRLHFHAEKIRFVIDRLKLKLLTDLDAKADDILEVAQDNLERANDIHFEVMRLRADLFGYLGGQVSLAELNRKDVHFASDALVARFSQSLSDRDRADGIPLVAGFDALLLHFQNSVSGEQTAEAYVSFLKARWLVGRMKEGAEFREARPGFYFRRAVNSIDRAISTRARDAAMAGVHEESVLLALPATCYAVWPLETAAPTPHVRQTDHLLQRPGERPVVKVELSPEGDREGSFLFIFSSDSQVRIIQEIQVGNDKIIIPRTFDPSQDRLIPRYALPELKRPSLELAIFSRNEEVLYKFKTLPELWKFQSALLHYEVSHDQSEGPITCVFSKHARLPKCDGRVQLWQDPLVFAASPAGAGASRRLSLASSGGSNSRRDSFAPSIDAVTTIQETRTGWEGRLIKLATLLILTQVEDPSTHQKRFATILLDLEQGIDLQPRECSCAEDYSKCRYLFIGKADRSTFNLRVSYSDVDSTGQPDPNSFDLFPFRRPRGAAFSAVHTVSTKYVRLWFDSLEQKRHFDNELQRRLKIREVQFKEKRSAITQLRHQQDHPERLDRIPAPTVRRSSTARSTATSIANSPPRVSVLFPGLSLAKEIGISESPAESDHPSNQSRVASLASSSGSAETDLISFSPAPSIRSTNSTATRGTQAGASRLSSMFRRRNG